MRPRSILSLTAAFLMGCAAGGPITGGGSPSTAQTPPTPAVSTTPLILDRTDLRLGTTVQFDRLPTASELGDLRQVPAVAHVVVTLPEWPGEADMQALTLLSTVPPEADVIAILPGWPPSSLAADAWDAVRSRLRIVVVVDGPPERGGPVLDINRMRAVERVIARMNEPSRSGFERLQRPLSFWKVVR